MHLQSAVGVSSVSPPPQQGGLAQPPLAGVVPQYQSAVGVNLAPPPYASGDPLAAQHLLAAQMAQVNPADPADPADPPNHADVVNSADSAN
jgi:hypothetical protein